MSRLLFIRRQSKYLLNKVRKFFCLVWLRIKKPLMPLRIFPSTEHLHLRFLDPCPGLIVDAGFNKGQFSSLSLILWPSASVYAFDPSPIDSPIIAALLHRQFPAQFHFYPFALSDKTETVKLYQAVSSDNSSLLQPSTYNTRTFRRSKIYATSAANALPLSACSIFDDVSSCSNDGLLKIDVQGYELNVLIGAKPIIHIFQWLYIEVTDLEMYTGQSSKDDIDSWINENIPFDYVSSHNVDIIDSKLVYADLLYRRRF